MHRMQNAQGQSSSMLRDTVTRLAPLLWYLATGTVITTLSQLITNKHFTKDSVQALAWVKYASTLIVSLADVAVRPQQSRKPIQSSRIKSTTTQQSKQSRLMLLVGCIDVIAYATFCTGFAYCGAAIATLLLAAGGQIFTAVLSRFALKKHLTKHQITSIAVVCSGLSVRGLHSLLNTETNATASHESRWQMQFGIGCLLCAAMCYALLGVTYQTLVSSSESPPSHTDIMLQSSKIGTVALTAYELVYVYPHWHDLVDKPMQRSGTTYPYAVGLLIIFGIAYNVHSYAAGVVYRTDGALGVGMVNAVRGAIIAVISGVWFCSAATPWQCLTPLSAASAAVVTAGSIMWVNATTLAKQQQESRKKLS